MEILEHVVLVLHLLGWAVVLGGTVVSIRDPRVPPGALHGILTALGTGVLLVLIASLGLDEDLSHAKIAAKLVVALVVAALVLLGTRRPERATRGLLGTILGLTALNVSLAVLW